MFNKLLTTYNKLFVVWIILGGVLTFFFTNSYTYAEEEIFAVYKKKTQPVTYDLYMPKADKGKPLPILVCVGGLPIVDGKYEQSSTQECMNEDWKHFADKNYVAILGVGFLFIDKDWQNFESYQYPEAWSGWALFEVLENVVEEYPVDPKELYFFGISAGAQFATRFAQLNPKISKAVCAHAAGGYTLPEKIIPTKFLLTVGEFDNKDTPRRGMAERFTKSCKEKGIDVEFKIMPGIAHCQTEEQNEVSREFLEKVLKKN